VRLKWLQWLRRGYRHCFVAVRSGSSWVICDPLSHRTDLIVVGDFSTRELADWYRSHGLNVVQTHVLPARNCSPGWHFAVARVGWM
jgi:hypothetical protein